MTTDISSTPADKPEVPQAIKLLLKGLKWEQRERDYYLGEGAYGTQSLMTREQGTALYQWLEGYGLIDRMVAGGGRKDFSMAVAFTQLTPNEQGGMDSKELANVGMDRVWLKLSRTAFEQLKSEHSELFQLKAIGQGR